MNLFKRIESDINTMMYAVSQYSMNLFKRIVGHITFEEESIYEQKNFRILLDTSFLLKREI
jgi:hypothetical protein